MKVVVPNIALARLGVGLVQGAALAVLYQALEQKLWPATNGLVFAPLLAVAIFIPILIVSGLGNLRARVLIVWAVTATIVCAALAFYDIARDPISSFGPDRTPRIIPTATMWFAVVVTAFIAHTMTIAGEADHRSIATYPTHFDIAWKHAVQFALAACFVGIVWGLLFLGAELFRIIHIDFFDILIRKPMFSIPATALALCCAIHITDVRANIVQGTRTLLLTLMSWLLPLMVLIGGGFIIALPFTGLEPLWGTRYATSILLTAAATLIVLINAVHQDGQAQDRTATVLRYAKIVAAIILLPLTALAAYAVHLRIAQYGWTPERIIAVACVVVAACYAAGYVFSIARTGTAMRTIESTNYVAALVVVCVLLALHSPILDPARISVADQIHRLHTGKVTPEGFDYAFLRFRAGRFGTAALEELAAQAQGQQKSSISERASQALQADRPYQVVRSLPKPTPEMRARNITVIHPSNATLPEAFVRADWPSVQPQYLLPRCLVEDALCDAMLTDLDGDGQPEILLFSTPSGSAGAFKGRGGDEWLFLGNLTNAHCPGVREALRAGRFETEAPPLKDLAVAGERLRVTTACAPPPRTGQARTIAAPPPR